MKNKIYTKTMRRGEVVEISSLEVINGVATQYTLEPGSAKHGLSIVFMRSIRSWIRDQRGMMIIWEAEYDEYKKKILNKN